MQRLLTFAMAVIIGALGLDGAEHALLERSMSGLKPPAMHDARRAMLTPPAVPVALPSEDRVAPGAT